MAQRKPDDETTFDHVLKLVDKLTPEDQERLMEHLEHQELKREVMIGVEQARRGELLDGEEVFQELIDQYSDDQ